MSEKSLDLHENDSGRFSEHSTFPEDKSHFSSNRKYNCFRTKRPHIFLAMSLLKRMSSSTYLTETKMIFHSSISESRF